MDKINRTDIPDESQLGELSDFSAFSAIRHGCAFYMHLQKPSFACATLRSF